ncbi:unnamed protein product, partial [Staurois parvus]
MQLPGTDAQCPDDQCPAVPPTRFTPTPVPSSAPTCAQKCSPAVAPMPSSAASQCPAV